LTPKVPNSPRKNLPPAWFVDWVEDERPQATQRITTTNGQQLTLIIQANPLDEISEAWQESLDFFGSLFMLTLLTFVAVNLVFNEALKSIGLIVEGLKIIETGRYQQPLPDFSSQEFDSIAKAINHMSGELDAVQRQNRALTQHSLEIQEDERQRLSQELHDELGQSLTAIKVMAATAAHKKADIQQITQAIVNICDHLIKVVRSMMHQLHPLILTELGLKASLEDLLKHWSTRCPALKLVLTCPDDIETLEQKITIQVFRVVQECLTNIVRHAQATQASISINLEHHADAADKLTIQVSDNGNGCNLEQIQTGFGLLGMKERIHSLGGEFSIQTQPTQGMSIAASIPLTPVNSYSG